MVILYIDEDRAILLLFYDDKDTVSTQCEIEISISQLIFTHKNIPKNIWDNNIHTLQNGRNIVITLHIYGDISIFLLFNDDQDTLSNKCEI